MGQNIVRASRVLEKFRRFGYASTITAQASGMSRTILAAEYDEIADAGNAHTLADYFSDPEGTKQPSAPTNILQCQRLAMLVFLVKYPHLAMTMNISSADMADLYQCFDHAHGGGKRYKAAYDRLAPKAVEFSNRSIA